MNDKLVFLVLFLMVLLLGYLWCYVKADTKLWNTLLIVDIAFILFYLWATPTKGP